MRKAVILSLGLMLAASFAWGMNQAEAETAEAVKTEFENSWENYKAEPITLSVFMDSPNDLNVDFIEGADLLVPNTIRNETGVSLTSTGAVDASEQSLNLLVASGEYPDLMFIDTTRPIALTLIENDQLWAFDDLKEQYSVDAIRHININQRFTLRSRFLNDKLYYLTAYGWNDAHMESPWLVKWQTGPFVNDTLYKSLGSPPIKSFADLMDFGKKAKAKDKRFEFPIWVHRTTGKGMFNEPPEAYKMDLYYGLNNPATYWKLGGDHKFMIQAPAFIDLVKDLNRMVHEEMINPVVWTGSKADKIALVMNGTAAVVLNDDTDNLAKRTAGLNKKYPDEKYVMLPPFASNPAKYEYTAAGAIGAGGDNGWSIPKNGKNTLRSAAFVDYIMSDDFQRLNQWGVEGETFDLVDGVPQWKPVMLDRSRNDLLETYGFNIYGGFVRDDYWAMVERQQRITEMREGIAVIRPAIDKFQDLTFVPEAVNASYPADSEEIKIYSVIKETFGDALTKIILSSPANRIEADYNALLQTVEKMGLSKLNAFQQKAAESFSETVNKYKY